MHEGNVSLPCAVLALKSLLCSASPMLPLSHQVSPLPAALPAVSIEGRCAEPHGRTMGNAAPSTVTFWGSSEQWYEGLGRDKPNCSVLKLLLPECWPWVVPVSGQVCPQPSVHSNNTHWRESWEEGCQGRASKPSIRVPASLVLPDKELGHRWIMPRDGDSSVSCGFV